MSDRPIRRALIAVYDKTGIVEFARALVDEFGVEILSTGGTAKHLMDAGIPVTLVETVTGFPEMLDGRVKTLHPHIHAGILADRDNPEHMRQLAEHGIKPIDMVVVNLYPFEKTVADPNCTFEQAIEMIDIGGPCLLRAAAKNHKHVLVVVGNDMAYQYALDYLRMSPEHRQESNETIRYAMDAFWNTSDYDADVSAWLADRHQRDHDHLRTIRLIKGKDLRYGENPHQSAVYYDIEGDPRFHKLGVQVGKSGTPISFNNILDANAALDLADELSRSNDYENPKPCCVFVKHGNPCGVAMSDDPIEAYAKAYLGDPNAAMGGILAVNFAVNTEFAKSVMESLATWGKNAGAGAFFLEVWVAPDFEDDDVVAFIQNAKPWGKNVRLLDVASDEERLGRHSYDLKRVAGGVLMQDRDLIGLDVHQWKVVTQRAPTDVEMADLRLAWLIAKHTKSNAISLCKDGMLIGNGAGQMSRVMSCRIATWLARENGHAEKLPGAAAASDAFFPFKDGPEILLDAGVTAIIQPGGSKRDEEVIAACDARGAAMIFTGTRHFKH